MNEHCEARARGVVSELPLIRRKRPPRPISRSAVVVASSRAVLLARRREGTLFGGLWEPPSTDGDFASFVSGLGLAAAGLVAAGTVVHVLSHRRMTVEVWRAPLSRRRKWQLPGAEYDAMEPVALDDVGNRAHSSLARKVLDVANVPVRSLRCGVK